MNYVNQMSYILHKHTSTNEQNTTTQILKFMEETYLQFCKRRLEENLGQTLVDQKDFMFFFQGRYTQYELSLEWDHIHPQPTDNGYIAFQNQQLKSKEWSDKILRQDKFATIRQRWRIHEKSRPILQEYICKDIVEFILQFV